MSIYKLLDDIRESSATSKEVGDKFERLMLAFFRTEPTYKAQFKNVWMWQDWPERKGLPDTGIDLVAENIDGSGFTAIQCKNYAPTTILDKKDIDSFFTESGKAPFTHRIIVSTTNLWTTHAENSLKGQDKPVRRIGIDALSNSMIDWDSLKPENVSKLKLVDGKKRRKHQVEAITAVIDGLKEHDRGKLIMACGTGKTYTAQCISEDLVGIGGNVLVLVPSISLLSQTVKEWTSDSSIPINVFAVCSDAKAGRRRETEDMAAYDLAIPATTNTDLLIEKFNNVKSKEKMNIILSTYQSIGIIHEAQKKGFGKFDLIIADEAHRTTGVTLMGEEDSAFTRVHDDEYIQGAKRLYMTATPRVYGDSAKAKADAADAWLASMDDYDTYGEEFYRLGFHEAVNRDLLTDYKVLILTVNEEAVASAFQQQLSDSNHELKLDDATRIVGCLNAFAKHDPTNEYFINDHQPMKRVVAFSNTINNSKKFQTLFSEVSERFKSYTDSDLAISVKVDHVDGSFNSFKRDEKLGWLKSEPPQAICHVLSNARCLTEGVDVPSLDAIVFLEPRNSMVDVVQAVGRVMRKNADKKYGYVILPIGIPVGITPEEALSDNKRYAAVWQVLNALRSHDERINAVVNKLDFSNDPPEMIEIVPVGFNEPEESPTQQSEEDVNPRALQLEFPLEEIRQAIFAKMVQKVGTRQYWENWAKDVAGIAKNHIAQITHVVSGDDKELKSEFDHFLRGLQDNLNPSITSTDAIEMLAQHLITKPVFDALFEGYAFTEMNPVSISMQRMASALEKASINMEFESLEGFYDSVRLRASGITDGGAKQKIIKELYEKFFKLAFSDTSDKLGIVYTPNEIVDFIIHSVDEVLKKEFKAGIGDKGVHILDPFTGTGTFIVRLLQSGLISKDKILDKYRNELHANELVLLAYYVAAINIEETFHSIADIYEPFQGVVLTDTFQMTEGKDSLDMFGVFPDNNERVIKQNALDIRVILGNPPYSVGQKSENDDNKNYKYEDLDNRILNTYAALSNSSYKNSLYDSYVRAYRWASDRIKDKGVVAFVSNGGWIDSKSADGLRKTLSKEFSSIYIFNLRGNARTQGEQRRAEGGGVFGEGSRTPVAITLLVKNTKSIDMGKIFYHDVGDYLTAQEKLGKLSEYKSFLNVPLIEVLANDQGDWLNQRSGDFEKFIPLIAADDSQIDPIFSVSAIGISTNRDAWTYNYSKKALEGNIKRLVKNYNLNVDSNEEMNRDPKAIKWSSGLTKLFEKGQKLEFIPESVKLIQYRPMQKQWLYHHKSLNDRPSTQEKFFKPGQDNLAIIVGSPRDGYQSGVWMSDIPVDLNLSGPGAQVLPLLVFSSDTEGSSLFGDDFSEYAITKSSMTRFSDSLGFSVNEEEIFYYCFGVLSSKEFQTQYQDDLRKMKARIPVSKNFKEFVELGRKIAQIQLGYESLTPYSELVFKQPKAKGLRKMRLVKDESGISVQIDSKLAVTGIPSEAIDYKVFGRSPLEWVIDRYQVREDSDSEIVNDPNHYSEDPNFIVDLIGRSVAMSVEITKLLNSAPKL